MTERLKFILAGSRPAAYAPLAKSLRNLNVDSECMTIGEAEEMFDQADVVMIDLDGSEGVLASAHRLASYHHCLVVTLSVADRNVDHVLHIQKPVGYLDIQLLKMRAKNKAVR